ncbi:hypothetical protein H6776_02300 [Candidatus Nomurabacteria bacterium]|nr:hypothetical protein [Candidatus Nomurabacteria bacterium]
MDDAKRLEQLTRERDYHVTRIFWSGLKIAILFAVPLAGAVALVKLVTSGIWSVIVLVIAFILSWILVIHTYMRLSRMMTDLDSEIRVLRERLGITSQPYHYYPDELEKIEEEKH